MIFNFLKTALKIGPSVKKNEGSEQITPLMKQALIRREHKALLKQEQLERAEESRANRKRK